MKHPIRYSSTPLFAFAFCLWALLTPPDARAANDMYLTIKGIAGGSTAEGRENAIELESFAWSLSVTSSGGSGGAGSTGKASFSDLVWTQAVDKALPSLMQAAAAQEHFEKATLDLVRPSGEKPFTYLTMTFEEVLITGLSLTGDEESTRVKASLTYDKLEMKVNVMDDKGGVKDYTGTWSLIDGKLDFAGSEVVYLQMANLSQPLDADQLPAVPEPQAWALLLAGLVLTVSATRRRLR